MTLEWLLQVVMTELWDFGMLPTEEPLFIAILIIQAWSTRLSSIQIVLAWRLVAQIRKSRSLIADLRDFYSTMMLMMTVWTLSLSMVQVPVLSPHQTTRQSKYGTSEKGASCTPFMVMKDLPQLPTSLQMETTLFLEEMILLFYAGSQIWIQSRLRSLTLKQKLKLKYLLQKKKKLISSLQLEEPKWVNPPKR